EGYKAIFNVIASSIDGMDFRAHIHMKSRHEDSPYVLTLPGRAVHEVIRRSPWHPRSWPHGLPAGGPPARGRVSRASACDVRPQRTRPVLGVWGRRQLAGPGRPCSSAADPPVVHE